MIDSMTFAQEQKTTEYLEKWKMIGLSTDRLDRPRAIDACKLLYTSANLVPPVDENFIFVDGPVDAFNKIKEIYNVKSDEVNVLTSAHYGNHEAYFAAYASFMKNELGVKNIENIEGLIAVSEHCGWVNVFEDYCILSERPITIKFDDTQRTHCETGPAIEYADGFKVYIWHGTRVQSEWIEHGISATDALQVENVEQRRAACEIVGWANIIDELNPNIIDEDGDPQVGTLLSVDIPEIGESYYLRVQCGTGRTFAIPVPPDMKTALEANAWTYGLQPYEYKPEVRT
tara:strand:+ start:4908 stop:5768 length:861 start_codon:yes stop_codon:yes gene_type:complete